MLGLKLNHISKSGPWWHHYWRGGVRAQHLWEFHVRRVENDGALCSQNTPNWIASREAAIRGQVSTSMRGQASQRHVKDQVDISEKIFWFFIQFLSWCVWIKIQCQNVGNRNAGVKMDEINQNDTCKIKNKYSQLNKVQTQTLHPGKFNTYEKLGILLYANNPTKMHRIRHWEYNYIFQKERIHREFTLLTPSHPLSKQRKLYAAKTKGNSVSSWVLHIFAE